MKKIETEIRDLYLNELIHQINYFIKHRDDYHSAAMIMIENSISVATLSKSTFKLTQLEIAKLSDKIFEIRK